MNDIEKTRIYKEYSGKVKSYIQSKVCDSYLAEDLCADVFVKVYEKYDTYDESKASISTWIFTIMRNTLFDYYRTRHVSEEIPEEFAEEKSFEDEVCNNAVLNQLTEALKQLPERERDLLILHYYSDMTLKDIAGKMGISYAYVKILHNKALGMVKEKFEAVM